MVLGSHTPLGAKRVWSPTPFPFPRPPTGHFISPKGRKSEGSKADRNSRGELFLAAPALRGLASRVPVSARSRLAAAGRPHHSGPAGQGAAGRLGPGPLRGSPRGVRFLLEVGRRSKAKELRPSSAAPRPRLTPALRDPRPRRSRSPGRQPAGLRGSWNQRLPPTRALPAPREAPREGGARPSPRCSSAVGPRAARPRPFLLPTLPARLRSRPVFGRAQPLAAEASRGSNPKDSLTLTALESARRVRRCSLGF